MTINYKTIEDRFFEKIDKINGCWIWVSTLTKTGYGQFSIGKTRQRALAHRFSYEFHKGKITEGKVIDHLCRNHACVNPDHLEIVTQQENIKRGIGVAAINARKVNCIRNHAFDIYGYVNKKGQRICSECKIIATRNRRLKYPNLPRAPYDPKKRREAYLKSKNKIIP